MCFWSAGRAVHGPERPSLLMHKDSRGSGLLARTQGLTIQITHSSGTQMMVRAALPILNRESAVDLLSSQVLYLIYPLLGLFFADMMTDSWTSQGDTPLPRIETTRGNSGVHTDSAGSESLRPYLLAVCNLHGILGLCAIVLLLNSIFHIRSSSPSAFGQYQAIQVGMAVTSILATFLRSLLSISSKNVRPRLSCPMAIRSIKIR